MNLTDFRDNALLKLQVGGPFAGGMVDLTDQEYVLIQVEQTEQPGQRRRRSQQVGVSALHHLGNRAWPEVKLILWSGGEQVIHNWTVPLHGERSNQMLLTRTFEMISRYTDAHTLISAASLRVSVTGRVGGRNILT